MFHLEQLWFQVGDDPHLLVLVVIFEENVDHHPILVECLFGQFANLGNQKRLHNFLERHVRTIGFGNHIPELVYQPDPDGELTQVQGDGQGNRHQNKFTVVLFQILVGPHVFGDFVEQVFLEHSQTRRADGVTAGASDPLAFVLENGNI